MNIKRKLYESFGAHWAARLPQFVQTLTSDIPKIEKKSNYICDALFRDTGRFIFLQIDYDSLRCPWMFSIGVVISDDRKIARQPPGGKSEALSGAIGSYGIWHFMDRLMYSWALYDPMADAKSLFPDLPMPQFGSDGTLWKPGNLGDRASPSIDLAVENATNSVIEFVMPCMDEYKNHLHQ